MKKISMKKIADMLDISAVTVHKALTNQKGVSDSLRARILEVAGRLGYALPGTDKEYLNFIFIINKDFILRPNEQFYSEIYYQLNSECIVNNAKLHLIVHDGLEAVKLNIKTALGKHQLDGIFVVGEISPIVLDYINGLKIPTTCIDFFSSDYPFDYIYVDNYYSGYCLTKFLIKKGHTKIGFIGDINFSSAIADRYFGYRRALNKYAIPFIESSHININIEREAFTLPKNLPSAYICHCDRAASFLYSRLQEEGLNVPNDISVVGIDNTEFCEHLTPKLTSFGIDKKRYASQAFKTMMAKIDKQSLMINYTKFNLDLYDRHSVLPLEQSEEQIKSSIKS